MLEYNNNIHIYPEKKTAASYDNTWDAVTSVNLNISMVR